MSLLDGKPHIATKEHTQLPWNGDKRNFRCGFCGHRFKAGDTFRFLFTNDMSTAPGNPLVCSECNAEDANLREKWRSMHSEFKSDKWWWFRRNVEVK